MKQQMYNKEPKHVTSHVVAVVAEPSEFACMVAPGNKFAGPVGRIQF